MTRGTIRAGSYVSYKAVRHGTVLRMGGWPDRRKAQVRWEEEWTGATWMKVNKLSWVGLSTLSLTLTSQQRRQQND